MTVLTPREMYLRSFGPHIQIHGDREMPVWGQLFKLDAKEGLGGADGDEATIERRIEALIDFIESFQR